MSDELSTDLASLRIDREPRPPSRAPVGLVLLAVAAGLGAGAYFVVPRVAPSIFKTEVAVTEVSMVSPAQGSVELTATGYVIPQRQAKVAAKVLSRIADMRVREGDRVKAGDVLYTTEDAEQRAALGAARMRVTAAKARAASARASLFEDRQKLVREVKLSKEGVVSSSTPEDREARVHSLEEAARAAELEASVAEEEVKAREVDLSYTVIRAPFGGVVLGKPLDPGELVGTFTEKPAVELADMSTALLEADVPEGRLGKVQMNGPAEVILDAIPSRRFRGAVVEIGSRVNRAKATVVAKVKFVDTPDPFLPDMAGRVNFLAHALDDKAMKEPPKLFLPRAALAERGGNTVVFQVDDGRVRMVPVAVVGPFGLGYELRTGPPPGARVVAEPPETLADGQRVKEKAN